MVELTDEERGELRAFVSSGSKRVVKVKRAQIILAADDGARDGEIAASIVVGTSTVYRTKQCFVEGGLDKALNDEPRPGARRKLSSKEEALLVATVRSGSPEELGETIAVLFRGYLADRRDDPSRRARALQSAADDWRDIEALKADFQKIVGSADGWRSFVRARARMARIIVGENLQAVVALAGLVDAAPGMTVSGTPLTHMLSSVKQYDRADR